MLGDKSAPVTIVEIVDLQCPFCRKHQLDVQPKIVKRLIRTGRGAAAPRADRLPRGRLAADGGGAPPPRSAGQGVGLRQPRLLESGPGGERLRHRRLAALIVASFRGPILLTRRASRRPRPTSRSPRRPRWRRRSHRPPCSASVAVARLLQRRAHRDGCTGPHARALRRPPDSYERILKAVVKAVEAGKQPEPFTLPRSGEQDGTRSRRRATDRPRRHRTCSHRSLERAEAPDPDPGRLVFAALIVVVVIVLLSGRGSERQSTPRRCRAR